VAGHGGERPPLQIPTWTNLPAAPDPIGASPELDRPFRHRRRLESAGA
jgi:hypothetical protein